MYSLCSRMLFTRYIRPQKQYIDYYYFCVVKMEELFAIAVSFAFFVRNRGFPPQVGDIRDILLKKKGFELGVPGENGVVL